MVSEYKLVLLGEGAVGKTSILLQYTKRKFESDHIMTIQASFRSKVLNIADQTITLNLWDTAGQEKFHSLALVYYRDANAAVLVYDVTDRDSFDRVQNWVQELVKNVDGKPILAIAANKTDLPKSQHVISSEEGREYAEKVGAQFFETSAKDVDTLNPMFLHIAKNLQQQHGGRNSTENVRSTRTLKIEDDSAPEASTGGCGC
ncbi:Rab21 [Carpediemonas membranifera]|uniref:Rab21 n=1 Tax=Carpediemonas membranifera TaxID=201153 RepID=A0A8J6E150_9EUKA|nr:Rab21 [Carpediemonas membranifera]|eukprot:KAG9393023.1 Rab21 [Carpediemonas membranifera]